MGMIGRIIRNSKVRLFALVAAVPTAFAFIFSLVATRDGLMLGESIRILWSMFWGHAIVILLIAIAVANWKEIAILAKTVGSTFLADLKRITPAASESRLSFVRYLLPIGILVCFLALSALSIGHLFNFARSEVSYLTKYANTDFKNRRLILARSYLESQDIKNAARIYAAVHAEYGDETSSRRLIELEQRYRAYRALLSLTRDEEDRSGWTPENAFRRTTAVLLHPLADQEDQSSRFYIREYDADLQALERATAYCLSRVDRSGIGSSEFREDAARLFEPQLVASLDGRSTALVDEVCNRLERESVSERSLAARWQIDKFAILGLLRETSMDQRIVCVSDLRKDENPDDLDPYENDSDLVDPYSDWLWESRVSDYARQQFPCMNSGSEPSTLKRWLALLWP